MKTLIIRNSFKKDIERVSKRDQRHKARTQAILDLLIVAAELPRSARPHILSGNWEGTWECHIAPDLLLIYQFDDTSLTLIRLGSHSDLF
jgi:mRNA interferase YafQ